MAEQKEFEIKSWDYGFGIHMDGSCISGFCHTPFEAAKDVKVLNQMKKCGIEIKEASDWGLWIGGEWFADLSDAIEKWRKK